MASPSKGDKTKPRLKLVSGPKVKELERAVCHPSLSGVLVISLFLCGGLALALYYFKIRTAAREIASPMVVFNASDFNEPSPKVSVLKTPKAPPLLRQKKIYQLEPIQSEASLPVPLDLEILEDKAAAELETRQEILIHEEKEQLRLEREEQRRQHQLAELKNKRRREQEIARQKKARDQRIASRKKSENQRVAQKESDDKKRGALAKRIVSKPTVNRRVSPAYPYAARRAGHEGTALVSVTVRADGRVGAASIKRSSGYGNLDASALKAIRKWRFTPARNGAGSAVSYQVSVPVTFRLN